MMSCSSEATKIVENEVDEPTYVSFGSEITPDGAISMEEMAEIYKNLEEGDTISVKFFSEVLDVCQKKGCWMKMDLEGEEKAFIRFTDYGFFVPFNAGNHEAIVEGRAFKTVISVDELKHYAKDAGDSQEEIDAITEPEITYAFQADGVLIKDIALEDLVADEGSEENASEEEAN